MSCHLFILKFPLTGILSHFFCVLTEMFAFLNQNHLLQISLPYRLVFKNYSSVLMKSDCDCLKIYSICKRKTIQINRLIFLRKLAMVITVIFTSTSYRDPIKRKTNDLTWSIAFQSGGILYERN